MLTEREIGYLSNEALALAPGQDMYLARALYRLLCANFEGEKDDWFWFERWWLWQMRDDEKPPLGMRRRERTVAWQPPLATRGGDQ